MDHPALGPVTISDMRADEFAFVTATWMKSSPWKRRDMVTVLERGEVLVARDDAELALAWLALRDDRVCHGYVRWGLRGNGLMRALWIEAGRPTQCADGVVRKCWPVLLHLAKEM